MSETPRDKWYHSVWAVVLGLFVVLGPLALPMLWQSSRFTRSAKMFLTVATLVYTVGILGFTYASVRAMMRQATASFELTG